MKYKKNNKNKPNNNPKKQVLDTKLKHLQPTLRQKKRFVKIKIESKKKLEFKEISNSLIEELLSFFGTIEFGKSGIWILRDKFHLEEQTLILKVSTTSKDNLLGVLSLIQKINSEPVNITSIRTSGTLKGVEKSNSN